MAIKINNTTVIDDSRNIKNVIGVGDTSTTIYYGDGSFLSGVGAGSGSGEFNVGINSVTQLYPLSYESTVFSFPSTAGKRYIIESINVSNIVNEEVNLVGALNYSTGGYKVHFAYNTPMVSGGSVELLKQPHVANPSDFITMWSNDANFYGRSGLVEVYMTYSVVNDTDYFGVGISTVGIATTSLVGIFTSSTNPSVIQSIHLTNRTDSGDYQVSVQITNGTSTSYIARNLLIPRYSTVELCDRPKRLETNGVIRVGLGETSTIDISISGKKITG